MMNSQPSLLGQQPHQMGPGAHQFNGAQFPPAPDGLAGTRPSASWGPVSSSVPQSMPTHIHNHPYMPPEMAPGMVHFQNQNGPYQPR